jgi:ElaB/YqjD/DUF883 family membrane-anchored ribosome-binding protein
MKRAHWILISLILISWLSPAYAMKSEDPTELAAKAIMAVTGVTEQGHESNPNGCLILSHSAAVAEVMLEKMNGSVDDKLISAGDRILIATGKIGEDLKKLFTQIKDSSFNVHENAVIIYGETLEKIVAELVKTQLVAEKLLNDQYKNVMMLGKNTTDHVMKVIGNLAMTGIFNTATIAVVAADYALAAGALCYEAAGVILTATVSGAILVIDYSVIGLTAMVQQAEDDTIYLTNLSAQSIVGVITTITKGSRYILQQTDDALNDVFEKIIAAEKAKGEKAVAKTEKMKENAKAKLKKALGDFGKKKDKILNHKIKICRIPLN